MVPFSSRPARHRLAGLALAGALAALVSACGPDNGQSAGAAQQGQPGAQASRVEVMTVQPTSIGSVRVLPGRATPFAEAEIRPQVTGLVETRLFTEGELVKQGQALYQIDADEYSAAVQSAQAAVERAEATAGSANETARRFERLADINAVSQQSYDEAVAAQKQAEADIGIQRAALQRARIDLARTKVSSPIEGRIGRSSVTQGALVTANQAAPLARVLQLDPIYIDMTASSAQVLNWKQDVAQGKIRTVGPTSGRSAAIPVKLKFENGAEYPMPGTLEFSEVSVDQEAGTVIVRAQFPNPDNLILPGMFLKAEFAAGTYENVYLVPQRAVQRTPTGDATAFVVADDNTVAVKKLTIQQARGSDWVVTDGLTPGDKVVVSGFQTLRSGATVEIVGADRSELTAMKDTSTSVTPE